MAIDRYRNNEVGQPVVSTVVVYAVWFFLGMFGGHRFVTGRIATGVLMLLMQGFAWLTWWFGLGIIVWGILGLWWLIDALLIPGWLRARY
jgi:TM2 domain-containing membrane protein YozV